MRKTKIDFRPVILSFYIPRAAVAAFRTVKRSLKSYGNKVNTVHREKHTILTSATLNGP